MPIPGIEQPQIINIDDTLRLRRFDGAFDFALEWYRDEETVWLVDGDRKLYDGALLRRMYEWLDSQGELYFIEVPENGAFRPVGDVTFWREDMPIVIGEPSLRGKGIGRRIVAALIERGRSLGYKELFVDEIYDWNPVSRRCFESFGFEACEKTEKGHRYRLELK